MPRTPRGSRPQTESKTALYAYFASRLRGVTTRDLDDFLDDLGIAVRQDSLLRSASSARIRREGERRRGRKAASATSRPPASEHAGVFRDWLLIDALALDVELALVRIPGTGAARGDLVAALGRISGVRHIIETARSRDLYLLLMFEGSRHRRDLRAQIDELVPEVIWDDVLWESQTCAAAAWEELARRAAVAEQLEL